MSELPAVTPEYFQILVVRELRKAGLDVGEPRIHRRSELPEPHRGFVLELAVSLTPGVGGRGVWRKRALLACYRQDHAVGQEIVTELPSRVARAKADVGVIAATADFEVDAVAAAQQVGIVLLQVVDARKTYDLSGWGTPGHYPAWLPAHGLQLVGRNSDGTSGLRALEAGAFEG